MSTANQPPLSPDARAALKQAVQWAQSKNPNEQAALLNQLQAAEFLNQIDAPQDYLRYAPRQLRLGNIFQKLMNNDSPAARQTLTALTQAPTFKDSDAREELLVRALAVVRPSPPEAIKYWDDRSTPDSIQNHFVMNAICQNGSEPALQLLEKKMLDVNQDPDFQYLWMRDPILRHRNDLPLLRACHRLLQSALAPELKGALVEALCAYRRDEWYRSCAPPVPPARAAASTEALEELRGICEYAKANLTLQPLEIVAVDTTLVELEGLLGS
jgi:hypothetical protein